MKTKTNSIILVAMITFSTVATGCKKDEVNPISLTNVVTSSGQTISMNGEWFSGCVSDNGMHLSETMTFAANQLIIDITFYSDTDCSTVSGTEKVTITFSVGETFNALLDGATVTANKITGTQTILSTGQTESFKQAFYVDDSGTDLIFHHARFQDDGGDQTSDGFPLEIIPIAIVKQ